MGLLKRLVGQITSPSAPSDVASLERRVDVVGEGHYQAALISIAGPKTKQGLNEGLDDLPVMIELKREPTNPYDRNAVQCLIEGKLVGYIGREEAPLLQDMLRQREKHGLKAEVPGYIIGGWKRPGSEGNYAVRLGPPPGHDYHDE